MRKLRITVGNKSYDVTVEDLTAPDAFRTSAVPHTGAGAPQPSPASLQTSRPQLPLAAGTVHSPMAGAIRSILVKQGDAVIKGQPLVILEAMKMENQITAPLAGKVKSVAVAEGEPVLEGQVLLVLD
jgi:biotin carboxyl carrier protein